MSVDLILCGPSTAWDEEQTPSAIEPAHASSGSRYMRRMPYGAPPAKKDGDDKKKIVMECVDMHLEYGKPNDSSPPPVTAEPEAEITPSVEVEGTAQPDDENVALTGPLIVPLLVAGAAAIAVEAGKRLKGKANETKEALNEAEHVLAEEKPETSEEAADLKKLAAHIGAAEEAESAVMSSSEGLANTHGDSPGALEVVGENLDSAQQHVEESLAEVASLEVEHPQDENLRRLAALLKNADAEIKEEQDVLSEAEKKLEHEIGKQDGKGSEFYKHDLDTIIERLKQKITVCKQKLENAKAAASQNGSSGADSADVRSFSVQIEELEKELAEAKAQKEADAVLILAKEAALKNMNVHNEDLHHRLANTTKTAVEQAQRANEEGELLEDVISRLNSLLDIGKNIPPKT
jgi:hypothetical protein